MWSTSANRDPCAEPTVSGLKYYDGVPLHPLLLYSLCVFLAVTLLRPMVFAMLLQPLSDAVVGAAPSEQRRRRKLCESAWRACLYSVAAVLAIRSVEWRQLLNLWSGWPHDTPVKPEVLTLYAFYIGMYTHQLGFVAYVDTRSSDHGSILLHHCLTLVLCLASWIAGFTRAGTFAMACHDVSDVFLEAAKVLSYSAARIHPSLARHADGLFLVSTLLFFSLRLVAYPRLVVYSALVEACPRVTCLSPAQCDEGSAWWASPAFLAFAPPLLALQLLQLVWGCKMAAALPPIIRRAVAQPDLAVARHRRE